MESNSSRMYQSSATVCLAGKTYPLAHSSLESLNLLVKSVKEIQLDKTVAGLHIWPWNLSKMLQEHFLHSVQEPSVEQKYERH